MYSNWQKSVGIRGRQFREKQVSADRRIGLEYAVGQANDRMQIAFLHQMFLETGLHPFAKERTIGQHHRSAACGLEQANDEGQKKVGRLASLKLFWKIAFDAVFFTAAEGRIGERNIDA